MTVGLLTCNYKGYKIFYSVNHKKFGVDTGKVIYFRDSVTEIKEIIDKIGGWRQ